MFEPTTTSAAKAPPSPRAHPHGYSLEEAAALTSRPVKSLWNAINRGELQSRKIRGRVFVSGPAVKRWSKTHLRFNRRSKAEIEADRQAARELAADATRNDHPVPTLTPLALFLADPAPAPDDEPRNPPRSLLLDELASRVDEIAECQVEILRILSIVCFELKVSTEKPAAVSL